MQAAAVSDKGQMLKQITARKLRRSLQPKAGKKSLSRVREIAKPSQPAGLVTQHWFPLWGFHFGAFLLTMFISKT
jgi:hypothetical protein